MATESKLKPIKDVRILELVKEMQGPSAATKQWTPDQQCILIWQLFRTNPAMKYGAMTDDEKKKAFLQWQADWANGRLAYPSNTARSLAEAGLAAKPASAEFEVDMGGLK